MRAIVKKGSIDLWCSGCNHKWLEHYKAGCYHIINPKADYEGMPRKYCACVESVNRLDEEPIRV
jgi:hypothetical protein